MAKNTKTAETASVEFAHSMAWERDESEIGAIEIEFAGLVTVNGKVLNEAATRFIVDWGFKQPLMNAYADPKKDAVAEFNRVLAKILSGDVAVEGRKRVSEVWEEMRAIVKPQLATALGHKDVNKAAAAIGKGWMALVDKHVRENESLLRPHAEKTVAQRKLPLAEALRLSIAQAAE
jgi:hypothetical protein